MMDNANEQDHANPPPYQPPSYPPSYKSRHSTCTPPDTPSTEEATVIDIPTVEPQVVTTFDYDEIRGNDGGSTWAKIFSRVGRFIRHIVSLPWKLLKPLRRVSRFALVMTFVIILALGAIGYGLLMAGCASALNTIPADQLSAPVARMCLVKSKPDTEAAPSTEVPTAEVSTAETEVVAEVPAPNVQKEASSAHEESSSAGEDIPVAQEQETVQEEEKEEDPYTPEPPQDLMSVFFNFVGSVVHSIFG